VNPDSNFHLFENILIDIGDEQSLEDDLSTFSSHLNNLKNILNLADENSLVILDEIGTGTDPVEGSALASAVLMKLRNIGALVFASTHHGSLKIIANSEERFINAAMEFDHEQLKPTYKFKLGVPGSSYAFEIARRSGIDDEVIIGNNTPGKGVFNGHDPEIALPFLQCGHHVPEGIPWKYLDGFFFKEVMGCNLMECTKPPLYRYFLCHRFKTKNPTISRVSHTYKKPDQLSAGEKIKKIYCASIGHHRCNRM